MMPPGVASTSSAPLRLDPRFRRIRESWTDPWRQTSDGLSCRRLGDARFRPATLLLSADSKSRLPSCSLRVARVFLEFAHKYNVDALSPSLTHFFVGAIKDNSVGIYASALTSKYQCEDVPSAAARACLNLPRSPRSRLRNCPRS